MTDQPAPDATPESRLEAPNSEVVIAVVAAAGTDLAPLTQMLQERLGALGYQMYPIRLSQFIPKLKTRIQLDTALSEATEFDRLRTFMAAGTEARAKTRNDVLALCAIEQITEEREPDEEEAAELPPPPQAADPAADTAPAVANEPADAGQLAAVPRPAAKLEQPNPPVARAAFCLLTLKNPEEVYTLRKVYGAGFFLIGAYSPESDRVQYLIDKKGVADRDAEAVVELDQDEATSSGQRTRDTFQLADAFVHLGAPDAREQINRILELLFGNPFITPSRGEHAMW